MRKRLKRFAYVSAAGMIITFGLCNHSGFAIEIAGDLLVDLYAIDYEAGSDTWTNRSNEYSDFFAFGNPDTLTIGESPAVIFDGASAFVGDEEAPSAVVLDESRTIEAWVFNPTIAAEETVVSWGKRGGPEGTNISFNYGNHGNFGAVGHWGGANQDMGWVDNDFTPGAPEEFKWHHLVYTWDPDDGFAKVYADGELQNEEDMFLFGDDPILTHDDTAIAIAAQWTAEANLDTLGDTSVLEGGLKGTLGIGQVRIHSAALSDEQILSNYNEELPSYAVSPSKPDVSPPTPTGLLAAPVHRYSFNNPESDDASDAELTDSIGGAHGVVVGGFGDVPEFTGTALKLPGGPADDAAYGDLPNGLISDLEDTTIETWITHDGNQNWSRIFDFGSNSPGGEDGELLEPGDDNGGNTEGLDYLLLAAQRGGNETQHRFEWRDEDPAGGGGVTVDFDLEKELPSDPIHFAVVVGDVVEETDFIGLPTGETLRGVRIYANGELVGEATTDLELANINDVNNWLGRSNWTSDANFEGSYDEFRIYDYALTADEIAGSIEAGPNELVIGQSNPLDTNEDGEVNVGDLDGACAAGVVDDLITALGLIKGDVDGEDGVAFGDFLVLSTNFGATNATYSHGDFDCNTEVDFSDFLILSTNFGLGAEAAQSAVPEPSGWWLALPGLGVVCLRRRRKLAP